MSLSSHILQGWQNTMPGCDIVLFLPKSQHVNLGRDRRMRSLYSSSPFSDTLIAFEARVTRASLGGVRVIRLTSRLLLLLVIVKAIGSLNLIKKLKRRSNNLVALCVRRLLRRGCAKNSPVQYSTPIYVEWHWFQTSQN